MRRSAGTLTETLEARPLLQAFQGEHARRIAGYDASWGGFLTDIARLAVQGATLPRVVEWFDTDAAKYSGVIPQWLAKQLPSVDLGRFADVPPPQRLAVVEGRYVTLPTAPSQEALFDHIAQYIDPEVDCIVEFGSGLGINLARLRLRLPEAPVTYIACEPSENGRHVAEQIFAADPAARFEARQFDYAEPDLEFLGRFLRIVAVTSHSIEQVPVLGEAFYRALLATKVAACIHIEPVGWQRFKDIADFVGSLFGDCEAWARFRHGFPIVIEDERVVLNAAYWAVSSGYNTDLLPLVAAAESRGDIALSALAYDVVGLNPFNPSTFIAWRRR